MSKAIFLDSVAGIAGDMFTAAFIDAGLVTTDELNKLAAQVGLNGVQIVSERVLRATATATRLAVEATSDEWKSQFSKRHSHDHHGHHHQSETSNLLLDEADREHWHVHYAEIDGLLERSSLQPQTRELARSILRFLGEAEADVHGIPIDQAAFHELGTIDSIMDVVMAAYCVGKVDAAVVFATPVKPGRGSINIAHGVHPVPPPATMRLLEGMPIAETPKAISHENIELSTPTGVAILKALRPTFVNEIPAGVILAEGRGSGTRDLGHFPNIFRLVLMEMDRLNDLPYISDKVVEIACNVDDDTGEHLAWMAEQLLGIGALDVWQTPGTGKKGRSMVCLSVLAAPSDVGKFADWILQNGTTFGIRYREWDRLKLEPSFEDRESAGKTSTYKLGLDRSGSKVKEKVEFESWKEGR